MSHNLLKAEQKINRLYLDLAKEKIRSRKRDTRKKIELGGLAILASVQDFPKEAILGALLDLKSATSNPLKMEKFKALGAKKFKEKKNE